MNESDLWKRIRRGMKGRWHAQRHTDSAFSGVPDVSYGIRGHQGWVELKILRRKSLLLRPTQLGWLCERGRHGRHCWLLVYVQKTDEYFLLYYEALKEEMDLHYMRDKSTNSWVGKIDFNELEEELSHELSG